MTTPVPQQQAPPPPSGLDAAALAVAVAGIVAGAVVTGATITGLVAGLKARHALTSPAASALQAVLSFVMQHPPARTGIIGAASEQVGRMNAARRAQYVIAASKRVLQAAVTARSRNQPVGDAVRRQLGQERRFYEMHQQAMWNRATAAGKADLAAAEYGPLLGWNTVIDGRTSPECRAADMHNFYAAAMPRIGFPGAVHPHCRCFPGPPYPGARLLPAQRTVFARAA
jgi:hypothetical protein